MLFYEHDSETKSKQGDTFVIENLFEELRECPSVQEEYRSIWVNHGCYLDLYLGEDSVILADDTSANPYVIVGMKNNLLVETFLYRMLINRIGELSDATRNLE